jgi:hypothetical protein
MLLDKKEKHNFTLMNIYMHFLLSFLPILYYYYYPRFYFAKKHQFVFFILGNYPINHRMQLLLSCSRNLLVNVHGELLRWDHLQLNQLDRES